MQTTKILSRLVLGMLTLTSAVPFAMGVGNVGLVLEPHCTQEDRSSCPVYSVQNADHLTTQKLNVGDIIDIDVVLTNAVSTTANAVRSWLQYDPQVLEARSIDLTSVIAKPTPDEATIDPTLGVVKIGGGLVNKITSSRVALARVTFRVKSASQNTEISFRNFQSVGGGETAVNGPPSSEKDASGGLKPPPCLTGTVCRESTLTPLLLTRPSSLTILLVDGSSSASSVMMQPNGYMPVTDQLVSSIAAIQNQNTQSSWSSSSQSSSSSTAVTGTSSFPLLQVQNLRVTSQEQNIFLGWNALRSSAIAGYNVYYGTVTGNYIQRRSIPSTASSLVLRDLEKGSTYYLAIRAFDAENNETVFSQEVSVEVGKPESSSAPLTGGIDVTPVPDGNPIEKHGGTTVSGSTGMGDGMLILVMLGAFIGTVFAAHRQYTLTRSHDTY